MFDRAYEWKAVLPAGIGVRRLSAMDRWIIARAASPPEVADLNLNYADLGLLVGCSGAELGRVRHRRRRAVRSHLGRRKVLIRLLITAYPAVGLYRPGGRTGDAAGHYAPSWRRRGAFCPPPASVAATAGLRTLAAAGLNQGKALPPEQLRAARLVWRRSSPPHSWPLCPPGAGRLSMAIPGLLLAYLLTASCGIPPSCRAPARAALRSQCKWGALLKSRNVVLAMVGLFCAMSAPVRHGGDGP